MVMEEPCQSLTAINHAEQTCAPKVKTSTDRDCHKTICRAVQPTMCLISFVPYNTQGRRIQLSRRFLSVGDSKVEFDLDARK